MTEHLTEQERDRVAASVAFAKRVARQGCCCYGPEDCLPCIAKDRAKDGPTLAAQLDEARGLLLEAWKSRGHRATIRVKFREAWEAHLRAAGLIGEEA